MYIAQYEKGWELYSASKATNMLICSSEEGVFDLNDPNMPDALRALIEDECAVIKQSLNNKIEKVDDSWSNSAILKNGFTNDVITYTKNGITKTLSETDLTPGHWVLIGIEKVGEKEISSPRLTVTKWGQGAPWNIFTPKKYNNKNELVSSATGCAAVAIAQYMYCTHYKDNTPQNCVTTATPTADGLAYTFSGSSSEPWDLMARYLYLAENNRRSAILIGWIAAELNSDFGWLETSATPSNQLYFLNKTYGNIFSNADFTYSYAKKSIDMGYPLLTRATTSSTSNAGHRFLIDGYAETISTVRYIYGYEYDEWEGEGGSPWEENERDENGNIVYNTFREEDKTSTSYFVFMNWGYDGYCNEVKYGASSTWEVGGQGYLYNKAIFKRSDVN